MKSSTEQFTKVVFSSSDSNLTQSGSKLVSKLKRHKLNLFGKGITFVKVLTQQQKSYFQQIKQLDISHNAISNFENLKVLPIQQINFSHNKLQDQQKIIQIFVKDKNCQLSKNIKKILLRGNPFLKKQLDPEFKRWIFSIQNDLDLFTKEENELLGLLVKRFNQKNYLQNMLNKILINTQLIREFKMDIFEDNQRLILLKPQDYFKIIRRQMEWKIQVQSLFNQKKNVVFSLPIQLFSTTPERTQTKIYVSPLTAVLRTRNQNLITSNKQTMQKIENSIFSYLTMRKMNFQQKEKNQLSLNQLLRTPYRQMSNLKSQEYPQLNTPIHTKKHSPNKSKKINSQQHGQIFNFGSSQQNRPNMIPVEHERQPRQILYMVRQPQEHNRTKSSQRVNSKQEANQDPITLNDKKTDARNGSRTLYQLSQSLLQKPIISEESLHFQLQQGVLQSQIQKMFFQILAKLNPIYHLLYSPVQTLKASQKSALITNLLQLVKQKLKYIQRLQKFKYLYQQLSEAHEQLGFRYSKEKYSSDELISCGKQMKRQMDAMEEDIKRLSQEVQQKAQQNMLIKEDNITLVSQIKIWKGTKLTNQQTDKIQEAIRDKRQSILKKSYLGLMSRKAYKLAKFKKSTYQIKSMQNNLLVKGCFSALVGQVQTSKNYRQAKYRLISNHFKSFVSTLKSSISSNKGNTVKTIQCQQLQRTQNVKRFTNRLIQNRKLNKLNRLSEDLYSNHLKSSLFSILKMNLQLQRAIQYDKIIADFKIGAKLRLKMSVFKEWLIWKKALVYKELQIRANHETVLACNFIGKLNQHYSKLKSHQTKSIALQLYLRDIRKFNQFHKFYMHVSLQTQKWKLKLFKINMFTKRIFLDDFFSGIRHKKLKRKIKEKDEAMTKKLLQFNEPSEIKLRRLISISKTKKKLRNCYFQHVKQQICFFKKQIQVEKIVFMNKIGKFFCNFKSVHKNNISLKSKKKHLSYLTKGYRNGQKYSQQFHLSSIFVYWRRQQKFKHYFTLFFINKNRRLMCKTFSQMRISCLQQKAQYFQEKLKELGPDIQLIEQRQIQTNIEKISLIRQMQIKKQQIEEYEKQVNQLKMLLQAKQIKYQKLKDIYAESVQINSKQRDFYELDNNIIPQYLPYQFGQPNLISNTSSKQDNLQKTLKYDSKLGLRRPISTYTKYFPQRDIKKSREKRKLNDYVIQSKKISDQIQRQQYKQKSSHKEEINQFYPSFRRF